MERNTKISIQSLPDEQKRQLIADFEQFERDGFIGDCILREVARDMSKNLTLPFNSLFMTLIAQETYRYFANKWLSEN